MTAQVRIRCGECRRILATIDPGPVVHMRHPETFELHQINGWFADWLDVEACRCDIPATDAGLWRLLDSKRPGGTLRANHEVPWSRINAALNDSRRAGKPRDITLARN
ncbi:MAG: hypothetical protein FWF90_05010 [Promicromonosporaceae bacterium]|nr:hypothetical protein [Promicromonosporaceae bacterium]